MSPIIEAPIIIIGSGGSGSTLVDRILGAHPDIDMKGEMNFLVANAWAAFSAADANTTLWNLAEHLDADPELESRIKASVPEYEKLMATLQSDEFGRRAAIMRRSIAAWFRLGKSSARFWGFKEIFNTGAHEWTCYDYLFPEARWVHVIRHPLHQLHAAARLSGRELATETIPRMFADWLAAVEMSRRRRATGHRYFEIRYEDLQADPERALSPLLRSLGVSWHDDCRLPLARQWGARSNRSPLPPETRVLAAGADGLERIMGEYGYHLDDEEVQRRLPCPALEPLGDGRWRIIGLIFREIDRCWEIELSDSPIAGELASVADDVGYWERSPLRLFENNNALSPPHALHYRIRRDGAGRYSHWQNRLLFSTSDNTDPNSNDRIYSFDLSGQ